MILKKKRHYNNIHFEVSCRLRIERYSLSYQKRLRKLLQSRKNEGKMLCISSI